MLHQDSPHRGGGHTPAIHTGSIWKCTRRSHLGWRVRIRKVSGDSAVEFEQVAGPAHSRGHRDRWAKRAFLSCYTPA